MSQSPPDVSVPLVPFVAAPYVLQHAASQSIACMPGLREAFNALSDTDKLRFIAVLRGDPTLGVGAGEDFDSAFTALSAGIMRHAVALLNLVDFIHSVRR